MYASLFAAASARSATVNPAAVSLTFRTLPDLREFAGLEVARDRLSSDGILEARSWRQGGNPSRRRTCHE